MAITIRLFAQLREAAGTERVTLPLERARPISRVMEQVYSLHPALRPYAPVISFAVNGEYAKASALVQDGDELALIPPISGG